MELNSTLSNAFKDLSIEDKDIPGDSLITDWTFSVAICSLHDIIHTFVTEHMTTLS